MVCNVIRQSLFESFFCAIYTTLLLMKNMLTMRSTAAATLHMTAISNVLS